MNKIHSEVNEEVLNQIDSIERKIDGVVFRTFLMTILDKIDLIDEFENNLEFTKKQLIDQVQEYIKIQYKETKEKELDQILKNNISVYEKHFKLYENIIEDVKSVINEKSKDITKEKND